MKTRSGMTKLVVGVGVAVLAACGRTDWLTDDVDVTWDFTSQRGFGDDLHPPYVRGATVELTAWSEDGEADFRGWSIASSDPAVFRTEDGTESPNAPLVVHGKAVEEGTAVVSLSDGHGHEIRRAMVEVVAADRIELASYGEVALGRPDAAVSEVRVVASGVATFLVRYFHGDREL